MAVQLRLRRHGKKAIQDTPTGLSHKGVWEALAAGRQVSRGTRFFASEVKRAQSTAALLSQRGKSSRRQKAVTVVPGIGFEAWPENAMSMFDRALFVREQQLKPDPKAKIIAEKELTESWIRGRLKDGILEVLIGKEPVFGDPKYHPRRPPYGFDARREFKRDLKFYSERKKELAPKVEGIPKASEVGKTIVENAIMPNLPERGVWKFFGKMIRPWKFLKRAKHADIVTHSANIEAVLQYLTGESFTAFPQSRANTWMVSELEPIEFRVSPFRKKVTLTYRNKTFNITPQIDALAKQMKAAA